jgi:uncharacterized protein YciW
MDRIDRLSGIQPDSALYAIRRERPEFVDGAELCRHTVLAPENGLGLGHALRAALAARMARQIGREDLALTYDETLRDTGSSDVLSAIATAGDVTADGFKMALVHHADMVTRTPRDATRGDIEKLSEAGLTNAQIVALSELIAFVNFEARIIAGLEALDLVE